MPPLEFRIAPDALPRFRRRMLLANLISIPVGLIVAAGLAYLLGENKEESLRNALGVAAVLLFLWIITGYFKFRRENAANKSWRLRYDGNAFTRTEKNKPDIVIPQEEITSISMGEKGGIIQGRDPINPIRVHADIESHEKLAEILSGITPTGQPRPKTFQERFGWIGWLAGFGCFILAISVESIWLTAAAGALSFALIRYSEWASRHNKNTENVSSWWLYLMMAAMLIGKIVILWTGVDVEGF